MPIEHLSEVYELLGVLEQPTAQMRALRLLLTTEDGAGTRLGGPSSDASRRCPRRCRPGSRAWDEDYSSKASSRGLVADGRRRWTQHAAESSRRRVAQEGPGEGRGVPHTSI